MRKRASRAKPDRSQIGPPQGKPTQPRPGTGAESTARRPPRRLFSLDAFRGLAVLAMLLVNDKALGPATPHQLRHARWAGHVHFADMVWPWFLLIVGVAIAYSAASQGARSQRRRSYVLRVVKRAAILVALGCVISSSYARRPVLGMGVLQIIGLAYLVAALLYGLTAKQRLMVAAALLAGHWAAIRFIPVPGAEAGVFTESHNLAAYLDQAYFQRFGLEGLLSIVPTSALVLVGTAIGDLLRREAYSSNARAELLAAGGLGLLMMGWLWHFDLPFNKPLWTASFVVWAAGWGALVLALFYWLIDIRGWRAWAMPLSIAGMNAVFAYVVPILVKLHTLRNWAWPGAESLTLERGLQQFVFAHLGPVPGGLAYTSGYILFWWLILLWMYRRRIFLRV